MSEPKELVFTSKIPCNCRDSSLVEYLCRRFTYHTLQKWGQLIAEGRVAIEGQTITDPKWPITALQTITYRCEPFEEPEANCNWSILYEDADLLVLNKPAPLLVHRSGKSFTRNLAYLVTNCTDRPDLRGCKMVSRLDKETSGCILVSKNDATLRKLHVLFSTGAIEKKYCAIGTCSSPVALQSVIAPIDKQHTSHPALSRFKTGKNGKPAQTTLESIEPLNNRGDALFFVRPISGRTHQIRVHLQSIGVRLYGDKIYCWSQKEYLLWRDQNQWPSAENLIKRQALHCASLRFAHPNTGETIFVSAPLAADMCELKRSLKRL